MKKTFFLVLGFLAYLNSGAIYATSSNAPQFRGGDIIFQTSKSSQSKAIQLATHSKWSHVGVIVYREGKPYVYEASGPVGYRTLSAWTSSGVNGKYMVRRYKTDLTSAQVLKLKSVGQTFASKPYDLYFGWTDSRIYCSELVWKIYYRALGVSVGSLQELGDFDLSHPEVQRILRERYGNNIPYEETVVSPEAIAVSPNLKTIFQN